MGEWLKPAVLKTVNGETRSGVRIPLPPPDILCGFSSLVARFGFVPISCQIYWSSLGASAIEQFEPL